MYYITFRLIDPETKIIRYTGVKYRRRSFSLEDIDSIRKKGTSNKDIKQWIKGLKELKKEPLIEVLYQGEDSRESCYLKQQDILKSHLNEYDLIAPKIRRKRYTKKMHSNKETRTPIIDQKGHVYSGVLEAAEELHIASSNISKVLHGHLEHASGYSFSFID